MEFKTKIAHIGLESTPTLLMLVPKIDMERWKGWATEALS
jgi:hypothetical protein